MNKRIAMTVLTCSLFCLATVVAADGPNFVADTLTDGDFQLVDGEVLADVFVDSTDHAVVKHAAQLLAEDVQRVTGRQPRVIHDAAALGASAVLIGTLGDSPLIDSLIARCNIDTASIRGQWETFLIQVVDHPLPQQPELARALIIVGSDRRGTAFGVFELSQQIGVSPWYWWADVAPDHRDTLIVKRGRYQQGPPSVKYRAIFLNDEDWGLKPWAAETFDPQFGNIGPKTYARIFELLLRLKANHIWPAMHNCTVEFGSIDENLTTADEWGIVMGAAHCEPMNRNNVWWKQDGEGEWRYDINRDNIMKYWQQWAQRRGAYEAVWTVGMRGIHDKPMNGPDDLEGQVKLLGQAIEDQRQLLREYVNPNVEQVPQVFMPYKEALAHYQHGLKLADDVTILWCDDNFGYIRQLSTPQEQRRSGGAGVYYHFSYLGGPLPYLWIDSTPPALTWMEMTRAYAYGADRIWVVNVGDLKPMEVNIDFWMNLAWDINRYGPDAQPVFLKQWATREFGPAFADEVASIKEGYYQLCYQRRPEMMGDNLFSVEHYDEAQRRLAQSQQLLQRAEALNQQLPPHKRDGFYELVLYPLRVAAGINEVFIKADLSRRCAEQDRAAADRLAQESKRALQRIEQATDYYNNQLAGGKWQRMIQLKGVTGKWDRMRWPSEATEAPEAPSTEPQAEMPLPVQEPTPSPALPSVMSFVESGGCVSMEAEHFTRSRNGAEGESWQVIADLGRTGDAVTVLPPTVPSYEDEAAMLSGAASLEYDMTLNTAGQVRVSVYAVPTHRIHEGRSLRYAIAFDDQQPQIMDYEPGSSELGEQWRSAVLRNTSVKVTTHQLDAPGPHTLKLWMVDPGVALDKLVVDAGGEQPSELGPPETIATTARP